jgi:fluoride exporter
MPTYACLLVALGGAVGSVLRYGAGVMFGPQPATTFVVNVVGSFLLGALVAMTADVRTRLLFGTGLLGGFTTFSTWQLEALSAAKSPGGPKAAIWILSVSLIAGFVSCFLGYSFGQKFK